MGVPGTVQGSVMLLCASHMANGLIFDKLISVALVTESMIPIRKF